MTINTIWISHCQTLFDSQGKYIGHSLCFTHLHVFSKLYRKCTQICMHCDEFHDFECQLEVFPTGLYVVESFKKYCMESNICLLLICCYILLKDKCHILCITAFYQILTFELKVSDNWIIFPLQVKEKKTDLKFA